MPQVLNRTAGDSGRIGIWRISETTLEMEQRIKLHQLDQVFYSSFSNEKRKRQWLGYRLLLQEMLGREIERITYHENGKPFIPDSDIHLSVSHSGEYAAAITSESEEVGIDIEKIGERVERVSERFISPEEFSRIGQEHRSEILHIHWGAREAIYKLYGGPDVDLQKDILLEPFDYLCSGEGTCIARVGPETFGIHFMRIDGYMLVYAVRDSFTVPRWL